MNCFGFPLFRPCRSFRAFALSSLRLSFIRVRSPETSSGSSPLCGNPLAVLLIYIDDYFITYILIFDNFYYLISRYEHISYFYYFMPFTLLYAVVNVRFSRSVKP